MDHLFEGDPKDHEFLNKLDKNSVTLAISIALLPLEEVEGRVSFCYNLQKSDTNAFK